MAMLASVVWTFLLLGSCQCYIDKTVYQYLVDNGYTLFVQLLKETRQDQILSGKGSSNRLFSFLTKYVSYLLNYLLLKVSKKTRHTC